LRRTPPGHVGHRDTGTRFWVVFRRVTTRVVLTGTRSAFVFFVFSFSCVSSNLDSSRAGHRAGHRPGRAGHRAGRPGRGSRQSDAHSIERAIHHVRDDDDDDGGDGDADDDGDDATRGDGAGGVRASDGAVGDVHVRGTTRARARARARDRDRGSRGGDRGSRGGDGGACDLTFAFAGRRRRGSRRGVVTMDFIFFARSMRSWDRRVDGDVGMSTPAARVGWSGERTLVGRMDESSSGTRRRDDAMTTRAMSRRGVAFIPPSIGSLDRRSRARSRRR